jgi:hypothetical protein
MNVKEIAYGDFFVSKPFFKRKAYIKSAMREKGLYIKFVFFTDGKSSFPRCLPSRVQPGFLVADARRRKCCSIVRACARKPHSYGIGNIWDDTDRSWTEGAAGNGAGEWVRFDFAASTLVAGFVLRNGYGNLDFYARNNRVKSFKVVFDGGYSETVAVKDSREFEQYRFAKTVTCKSV